MTVQYQGVWSLQSAAQLQSTQRWVTDPLFDYTTLLLQADDAANGAQNNTFLDSSSNAFAITRNGNTTQGSFTPFSLQPGAWSTYFPGASSLIVPAGSAFAYGTGNFTVEAWINPYTYQAGSSTGGQIISQTTSGQNYFVVQLGAAGELNFTFGSGGGTTISTAPGSIPLGIWTHVAVVREGTGANQLKLYVNGFLLQSGTCSFNFTDTTYNPTVGNYTHNSTQLPFGGYISNLRVVKGVAVYTGNFTPSSLPLAATQSAGINTAAITGTQTSLLTAQSNRFLDNSVANAGGGWTVTLGGTPSVQAFSPFAPQFQWTPSVIGGSGYFDGSGDFLSSVSTINFGTNPFTVEFWIYPLTLPSNVMPFSCATNGAIQIQTAVGNISIGTYGTGSTLSTTGSPVIANQWNHIVAVRSSTSTNGAAIFVNGSRNVLGTVSTTYVAGAIQVGGISGGTQVVNGYLSGLVVTNGTANYSPSNSSISVPSVPPSATSSTLCINFTNAGIYDGTMKNNLETLGNAQVSTAVVKYGSGSISFPGNTSGYISIPSSRFFNQLYSTTQSFTIEFWTYVNSFSVIGTLLNTGVSNGATGWRIDLTTSGILQWVSNGSAVTALNASLATGTWYHVAYVWNGSQIAAYINGVRVGIASTSWTNTNDILAIGSSKISGFDYPFNGYLDDLRITTGIARYTQNFIPPSVALPRQ